MKTQSKYDPPRMQRSKGILRILKFSRKIRDIFHRRSLWRSRRYFVGFYGMDNHCRILDKSLAYYRLLIITRGKQNLNPINPNYCP